MFQKIEDAMKIEEEKAWEALSGYKFVMFGYHASLWVNYKRLMGDDRPNPFSNLVKAAQEKIAGR